MNVIVVGGGATAGLGAYLAVGQLVPGRPRLEAALARIHSASGQDQGMPGRGGIARYLGIVAPWLPVPEADLELLGTDRERWMASKVIWGLVGLGAIPALAVLLTIAGQRLPWEAPAVMSVGLGLGLFFLPDLITRVNAAEKRDDFRHALTSYLDLVSLERGGGAGPTQALEAAAHIGGGWAFARISAALEGARKAGRPPWEGLADLAVATGVSELADLAEIAEVAGEEGARIMQTLAARAESMRIQALAALRAKAGSRSTTMVVPIALLGIGFLLLLIFPVVYRTFG